MEYAWQGGQEGGNGTVDILMGEISPSGKLATTIAKEITDYPSDNFFGDPEKNCYAEDIYVGYRYFDTFPEAKDKVLYPFGYGISYTTFEMSGNIQKVDDKKINVEIKVKNTGNVSGKEVAIVYIDLPEKYLGKPKRVMAEISFTDDKGYKLSDVYNGKIDLDTFIAQLSDADLVGLFHGEGMCSNKVTPGIVAAFGGVTSHLSELGVPAAGCSDGPSGIRMDCGTKAFSVPNGAAIASSFNEELTEELFEFVGLELRKNKIDSLLGPGINIIRHPLNGRNFEYFSEDPLLTGLLCNAQLRGFHKCGVTGTIKHFCANNQEMNRYSVESVVSERALREIYLKAFEISVKEGKAKSIMTSYNPVNGFWTAGYFELCTVILREQWGYEGIVMSDWWAKANWPGTKDKPEYHAAMVRAQNDIFMVCQNSEEDLYSDDVMECLESGKITRAQLQRNAKNILKFVLESLAMKNHLGTAEEVLTEGFEEENEEDQVVADMKTYSADTETGIIDFDTDGAVGEAGKAMLVELEFEKHGYYDMELTYSSELGELAQLPVSVYYNNMYITTVSVKGTLGETLTTNAKVGPIMGRRFYFKFAFGSDGLKIKHIRLKPI